MEYFAGLDVSMSETHVCVVTQDGAVIHEVRAPSTPAGIVPDPRPCCGVRRPTLLSPADHSWSAEDWLVFFEERAGIAEFDGGLERGQAEDYAFEQCVAEWLCRNPVRSLSGHCVTCGGVHEDKSLPSRNVEGTDRVWLHAYCGPVCHVGRQVEAVTALAALGIARPVDLPDDFGKNGGA